MPGVIYGGDGEPSHFAVDARILRNTLAHSGAILDIDLDGGTTAPVLVKDLQRHPVRGEIMHVDFLRVNMNETIQTVVVLELVGADERPGRRRGRRALPGDARAQHRGAPGRHPGRIQHDVSGMEINETLTLADVDRPRRRHAARRPRGDVIATITPPTAEPRRRTRSRPRPRSWARSRAGEAGAASAAEESADGGSGDASE